MAEFCKQCSIGIWGEELTDLANVTSLEDESKNKYALVLCEGCGAVQVNNKGECISHIHNIADGTFEEMNEDGE